MSGTALQPLYDLGYAITAQILGVPYAQFRANGPNTPTMIERQIGTLLAWITTDPKLQGTNQTQYGKPGFFGAFERDDAQVGDYLVGQDGTYFVTALDYPAPASLIKCNAIISIARASDTLSAGSSGVYGGSALDTATPFMTGWPCYAGQLGTGRGSSPSGLQLPSDAKLPDTILLIPSTCPEIRFNDVITDDEGVRSTVNSVELTSLGYRLSASVWPSA